jgi:DNA-binding NtrC family response regulator
MGIEGVLGPRSEVRVRGPGQHLNVLRIASQSRILGFPVEDADERHHMKKNKPAKIMDVDDDGRRAIQRVLEKVGYSVTMVADAEGALELVADIDFDLIISDLRMPGKTGIELLSEVKNQKPETQFLSVSAYGDGDTEALAKRMGASEVLSKPFPRQKLIDCTVRVLG